MNELALRVRHPTYNGVSSWDCWGMPGPPDVGGQVIAADNEANVFVISLGAEDGVTVGLSYTVSRGGHAVATIQITHVQDRQSAGHAVGDIRALDIHRGDRVRRSDQE